MSAPELTPRERSVFSRLAQPILAAWDKAHKAWARFAEYNQSSPWFPFILAALVGFDAFIVILPGDIIVALAVLSNPKQWRKTALASALGSAIGSYLLFLIIHHYGKHALDNMAAAGLEVHSLRGARAFFKQWGLFSLALGSVIPGMTWPPVVMAGLSSDAYVQVFAWLCAGRTVRFFILSLGMREGWAMFQAVKQEAKEKKAKAEDPPLP